MDNSHPSYAVAKVADYKSSFDSFASMKAKVVGSFPGKDEKLERGFYHGDHLQFYPIGLGRHNGRDFHWHAAASWALGYPSAGSAGPGDSSLALACSCW